MSILKSSGRRASHSETMAGLARFGLAVRGFVYLVIGWLALQIALGEPSEEANQVGALATVAQNSYGQAILWMLGLGFAAYALWRLSEAVFGTATDGPKAGPRVQSLVRGIVYAFFAVTTFSFIAGATKQSQAQQQASTTARLMQHTYGRWLIGIVGVIVVIVGLAMVVEGLRRKFVKELRMNELQEARGTVVTLGMIGTTARGIVFAVAGALVVDAAVDYDASKSTGLDGALRTLADRSYGEWLLGALAIGLIAFGLYGLAAARYVKT